MMADRLPSAFVCAVALVCCALLAPGDAGAVPGGLRPGLHAYDETGAVLVGGLADDIDDAGEQALDESGVQLVAYAAEQGDPAALAADVARSWALPADAVVIGVVRDPPGIAVRPAGRLTPERAAAIEAAADRGAAQGELARAARNAAREVQLAVRTPEVADAARERDARTRAIFGALVLLMASGAVALVVLARRGAATDREGRPLGVSAAELARLTAADAPAPAPTAPRTGRAAWLAVAVVVLALAAAAIALAREGGSGAALILAVAGLVGALAIALAARSGARDDPTLDARIYAARLAASPEARAAAPADDLVALGLSRLPEPGEEGAVEPR